MGSGIVIGAGEVVEVGVWALAVDGGVGWEQPLLKGMMRRQKPASHRILSLPRLKDVGCFISRAG